MLLWVLEQRKCTTAKASVGSVHNFPLILTQQFFWLTISLELGEKLELGLEILFSNYNLDLL